MTIIRQCQGITKTGEPCATAAVAADGWCYNHRPGEAAAALKSAAKAAGARGLALKYSGDGFTLEELPAISTLEDAKLALDQIRRAVMMRRLTHSEGTSASTAVDRWVRAESAAVSVRLVGELQRELDTRTKEIEALRKQLSAPARPMRVVS
jgi:hypothetical protein